MAAQPAVRFFRSTSQYNNVTVTGPTFQLPRFPTNAWRQFIVPLSALGMSGITNVSRISFQLTSSGTSTPFFLDDVSLSTVVPLVVHLQINATNTLRTADSRWFGLNTAIWDAYFDTPTTSNALKELGTQILRFPGGSASDEYHWASDTSSTNTWTWATSFWSFMHLATNMGAQAIITANYGTGTPGEAAAWVGSANVTNRCNFKYWEIGNECYGTWETDSNSSPHDPYTYATNAAQYLTQMKAADPTIKIGVPVSPGEESYNNGYSAHPAHNPRTGADHNGWTPVVLATMKSLGVLPDFLVYHVYPEYGNPNDQTLLQASGNWAGDAADLRQQITDYIGASGTNIELFCTENNSDAGSPQTRQSTSIVNGLYLADSLANLMKTEFNSYVCWDLRNGQDPDTNVYSNVYGWRTYGDIAIIGNLNTRYPTYYTFKLMHYFAHAGDTVLDASSDYFQLPVYSIAQGRWLDDRARGEQGQRHHVQRTIVTGELSTVDERAGAFFRHRARRSHAHQLRDPRRAGHRDELPDDERNQFHGCLPAVFRHAADDSAGATATHRSFGKRTNHPASARPAQSPLRPPKFERPVQLDSRGDKHPFRQHVECDEQFGFPDEILARGLAAAMNYLWRERRFFSISLHRCSTQTLERIPSGGVFSQ